MDAGAPTKSFSLSPDPRLAPLALPSITGQIRNLTQTDAQHAPIPGPVWSTAFFAAFDVVGTAVVTIPVGKVLALLGLASPAPWLAAALLLINDKVNVDLTHTTIFAPLHKVS